MDSTKSRGNGHVGNDDRQGIGQRFDNIGHSAQEMLQEAKGTVSQISESLDIKGRVDRHPYGMVLAAMGVGYVLGGGLFTPFTARMLRLGLKLAAIPLVKDELVGMAESAVDRISNSGGTPRQSGGEQ